MADLKDILVEIPVDHLPGLAALYEKHAHWAPHVVSLVHMGIRWKKSVKFRDRVCFLSPDSSWQTDGTIIVLMKSQSLEIFPFTLDDKCVNLCRGLIETNLIDYNTSNTTFFCIHEKHIPAINKVVGAKKLNVRTAEVPFLMYAMPPEQASKLSITCPADVFIKKLDVSSAQRIDSVWPHRFPGSDNYLASLIEINGGYGLFLRETDELVAWVLKHCFGHIGMLQTDDGYKKRGYGSLVAKVLAKEIGDKGYWPLGTIMGDNLASIKMFEKLGFRKIGECAYFTLTDTVR